MTIDKTTPSAAMKVLVDQHGLWVVLRALTAVILRPKPEMVRLEYLSPHLRRDLGLPPVDQPRNYRALR